MELEAANLELAAVTFVDELTGLLNRRGFTMFGEQELSLLARMDRGAALLFVDVDGLKPLNDEHGHDAGDDLLQKVAWGLRRCFRDSDVIARLGGDEFGVILTGARAAADAAVAAERVNNNLRKHAQQQGRPYPLSVSVGIAAASPGSPFSLHQLLQRADEEMYRQKRQRDQRLPDTPAP